MHTTQTADELYDNNSSQLDEGSSCYGKVSKPDKQAGLPFFLQIGIVAVSANSHAPSYLYSLVRKTSTITLKRIRASIFIKFAHMLSELLALFALVLACITRKLDDELVRRTDVLDEKNPLPRFFRSHRGFVDLLRLIKSVNSSRARPLLSPSTGPRALFRTAACR